MVLVQSPARIARNVVAFFLSILAMITGLFDRLLVAIGIKDLSWKFTELLLHRVVNPFFIFENPSHWQGPILPVDEVFPGHKFMEEHWKVIRDEAVAACSSSDILRPAAEVSPAAFKTLAQYSEEQAHAPVVHWKTAVLKFYGKDFPDMMAQCPKTTEILSKLPEVDVAMFSVMEPGATIPVHRGPLRAAARYHLPLVVPGYDFEGNSLNNTPPISEPFQPGQCHIVVGEDITKHYGNNRGKLVPGCPCTATQPTVSHVWAPGQGVLFDDTYAHSVANHHPSKSRRIVLFCDVRRPPPGNVSIACHSHTTLCSVIATRTCRCMYVCLYVCLYEYLYTV